MAHYLVTGGAGFIGSHLAEELVRRGHRVRVADSLVTGKRRYAHGLSGDPGSQDPPVLLWLRTTLQGGLPSFQPLQIDANSGVGTQFLVRDMNRDGRLDVVTSNKLGVYVHLQGP